MLSIGITGGTGCGKTALLYAVQSRGGAAVDCDALYYDLLRTDKTLRAALTDAFGEVFLSSGSLDRQKLAAIVFSDARQLTRLNKIVFFHVRRAAEQLQQCQCGKYHGHGRRSEFQGLTPGYKFIFNFFHLLLSFA